MLKIDQLAPSRIIPVVVIEEVGYAERLREALKSGGLTCAEVTFRTSAAGQSIRIMAEDPDFCVGAGTVLTGLQVDEAVQAGARFIVSPGIDATVVEASRQQQIPVFPGVITPSEIMTGLALGLSELKFFPAGTAGGPAAIRALGGPFGSVSFIPTGGISPGNVHEYLSLPNVAAIGGTWLTPASALRAGDFRAITELTREAVRLADQGDSA